MALFSKTKEINNGKPPATDSSTAHSIPNDTDNATNGASAEGNASGMPAVLATTEKANIVYDALFYYRMCFRYPTDRSIADALNSLARVENDPKYINYVDKQIWV